MRSSIVVGLLWLFFHSSLSSEANRPGCHAFFKVGWDETAITRLFQEAPLKPVRVLEVGDSKPVEMELESGLHGVFKPKTERDNPAHEVAAYRVDRMLGLNLVPLTVLREHEGKTGSLQHFVENGQNPYSTMSFVSRKMRFLDLVIANTDRSGDNFLVLPDGRQVAIDNMKSFNTIGESLPHEWILRQALPDLETYERYKNLSTELIHSELDPLLGTATTNKFIRRRDLFVKRVESWIRKEGVKSVFKPPSQS